jgi:hypothetical protein
MTKSIARIKLTILATIGHKLSEKEMDELANALQENFKEEIKAAYNIGKHDALENIEILSEEYYQNKYNHE